jgi:predicted MPP superfamily phosphohydrolase
MQYVVILLIIEALTVLALKDIVRNRSGWIIFTTFIVHFILSIWLWKLLYETVTYKSFFDTPEHIALLMNVAGFICAVVIPRLILILFHFTGRLFRIRKGGNIRWMTCTGVTIGILNFSIITFSTFYTRFNFTTEKVEIKIKGLNSDLDGLRIVHLSDMHLSAFYNHGKSMRKVMDRVNALKPDLILNTGDFVTFGWREFDSFDTILSLAKSRYGNYAVMGNHDFGTYHPFFTEADRNDNVLLINNMIIASGYTLLNDTNTIVRINGAKIGLIGIITKGRHPDILHGDLGKAMSGLDSADLKILLSHDPNQWEKEVVSKTDIDITLSGHTHGMQMGIYTNMFKWSPSKYFYPHWGGLFIEGDQVHYVNLGLGVLAIPFRIWMPPEITVITLKRE